MVNHRGIGAGIQTIPPKKIGRFGIAAPLLVFQKLLPHKELRNARSGEQNSHRETCPATCVPGSRIGRISQPWDSWVGSHFDDVVILNTGDSLPTMAEAPSIERTSDAVEVDSGLRTR